jgi:hypothetical protein
MAGRVPDRSPDGQDDAQASQTAQPDRRSEDPSARDGVEREKAETEIAAGDVADDLADFA